MTGHSNISMESDRYYHVVMTVVCNKGHAHALALFSSVDKDSPEHRVDYYLSGELDDSVEFRAGPHSVDSRPGISLQRGEEAMRGVLKHAAYMWESQNPHGIEYIEHELNAVGREAAGILNTVMDGCMNAVDINYFIELMGSVAQQARAELGAKHRPVLCFLDKVAGRNRNMHIVRPQSDEDERSIKEIAEEIKRGAEDIVGGLDFVEAAIAVLHGKAGEYNQSASTGDTVESFLNVEEMDDASVVVYADRYGMELAALFQGEDVYMAKPESFDFFPAIKNLVKEK